MQVIATTAVPQSTPPTPIVAPKAPGYPTGFFAQLWWWIKVAFKGTMTAVIVFYFAICCALVALAIPFALLVAVKWFLIDSWQR